MSSSSILPPSRYRAYVVQIVPPAAIEQDILAMEKLLYALACDEPFSLELVGELHRQYFLLRTNSETMIESLCQQVQAHYPQAQIKPVPPEEDPIVLKQGERAFIGQLGLRAKYWLPIKTFDMRQIQQEATDPIIGLLASMEPVHKHERIICQMGLTSAPDTWGDRFKRLGVEHPLAREREETMAASRGVAVTDPVREILLLLIGLVALIVGLRGYLWYRQHDWPHFGMLVAGTLVALVLWVIYLIRHQSPGIYDMELVATKLMRVAYYLQLRVVVISPEKSPERRERMHLERLCLAYRQYNLAGANGFVLHRARHVYLQEPQAAFLSSPRHIFGRRTFLFWGAWSKDILNARETSGMWHLPQGEAEVPLIERLPVKKLLAHPDAFQKIRLAPSPLPPVHIGNSVHRGHTVPVLLPAQAIFAHKLIVARSGYGKSTLMQIIARGAMLTIQKGMKQPGVFAMDPHGDFVNDLLHQIPDKRTGDVILIDLEDETHPVGINLLDATMGFTEDQAVANILVSFSRLWGEFWGPRMAYVLKHALQTLYCLNLQLVALGRPEEQYTLLDVNPLLQHLEFTRLVLASLNAADLHHQELLAWWRDYYFRLPVNFKQEVISPVITKIGAFADNVVLKRIVGQPISTIDVTAAVSSGKIFLVNLASSRIEFDAAAIIGGTLLNLLHRALQGQAVLPMPERRKVLVAVDEFQNIPGADYESLWSEDRKYGGSLMVATQSLVRLEQIKEGLMPMAFANCEQLYVFATSAKDAELLEQELHERIEQVHIMNQPPLHCYARLVFKDQPVQIVSLELIKPLGWRRTPASELRALLIRSSNQALHPSSADVDTKLATHAGDYLDVEVYAAGLQLDVKKARIAKNVRMQKKQQLLQLQQAPTADLRNASQGTLPMAMPSNGTPTVVPGPQTQGQQNGQPANAAGATSKKRKHPHPRSKHNGKGSGKPQAAQRGTARTQVQEADLWQTPQNP